ncbi:lytic polysaccharide monooxygenase [Paraliobacillus sp. JSM ZJ581]|uniref:lytic polysaccharide monooxygenase n=1 Tax=Paraliobacillus sp. JSM ZJ581 TaxID=3342118 RepID=UPI0035A953D7
MMALSFGFSMKVSAHGYVNSPESRSVLCQQGINNDCGGVTYEPQSVEGPGNFPEAGVADGQIASGGGVFPKLDEQSENRWAKVPMSSGAYTFNWKLTAAHATENWDYYITKENWDPNQPLKRSDLELFCSVNDGGKRPDFNVSHDCVVPQRTGYHVILAYWEVADTANAFYQVIDANFDGGFIEPGNPGEPENPGEPSNPGEPENPGEPSNPGEPENPGEPSNPGEQEPAWDATKVYQGKDRVTYNGKTYQAKWWTQGDTPGEASVWSPISEGNEKILDWNANTVYKNGDLILYDGKTYQAKWWTEGDTPGVADVWQLS